VGSQAERFLKNIPDRKGKTMQWFKHLSSLRRDPKIWAIEKKLGEAGYARAVKLLEIVAEHGEINLRSLTSIDWLADELRISAKNATQTLEVFADVGLIDTVAWANQVIRIPVAGPLHRRKPLVGPPKGKAAQSAPFTAITPLPLQAAKVDAPAITLAPDTQKNKDAAIAADVKEKAAGCWEPIGIPACGLDEFREIWQRIWEEHGEKEKLSETMERCIKVCEHENVDVAIPAPFRRAWQAAADKEFWEEIEEPTG
jgi:hypothetical protein